MNDFETFFYEKIIIPVLFKAFPWTVAKKNNVVDLKLRFWQVEADTRLVGV